MREWTAAREWRAGVAFVADERHSSASGASIAHYAKRILRLYGVQRRSSELQLPLIEHIVLPSTPRENMRRSWSDRHTIGT